MAEVTPERLAEIEARARAATEGPWFHVNNDDGACMNAHVVATREGIDDFPLRGDYQDRGDIIAATLLQCPRYVQVKDQRWEDNAIFLAHSRTDVPDLIAALRASWARAEAAEASEDALRRALEEAQAANCRGAGTAVAFACRTGLRRPRTSFAEVAAARREACDWARALMAWMTEAGDAPSAVLDPLGDALDALAKAEGAERG